MRSAVLLLLQNEGGTSMLEYAVITGVIMLVGMSAMMSIGRNTNSTIGDNRSRYVVARLRYPTELI